MTSVDIVIHLATRARGKVPERFSLRAVTERYLALYSDLRQASTRPASSTEAKSIVFEGEQKDEHSSKAL